MDREKVIRHIAAEISIARTCKKDFASVDIDMLSDAYELLKEQEAVKRTYRTGINGFSVIWTCGACGSDLYPNNAKAKYCSNCGQAVKWE